LSATFNIDMTNLEFGRHFRCEPNLFSIVTRSCSKDELKEKVPVTLADLLLAVKTGTWPL
jgi:hypothetical protein